MAEKQTPNPISGEWKAVGVRIGIVVSRFNSFITERLLAGALDSLHLSGLPADQIDVVRVPGSFEIPIAAKQMGASGRYGSLICIGCILRGETQHFEYISTEVARGVQLAQLDTGVPMIFCVLTCDTLDQAVDRAGLKSGNKGAEAGLAALEMASLSRKLRQCAAPAPVGTRPRRRRRSR